MQKRPERCHPHTFKKVDKLLASPRLAPGVSMCLAERANVQTLLAFPSRQKDPLRNPRHMEMLQCRDPSNCCLKSNCCPLPTSHYKHKQACTAPQLCSRPPSEKFFSSWTENKVNEMERSWPPLAPGVNMTRVLAMRCALCKDRLSARAQE